MAEMVSSAVVGETVNRIMSSLVGKDEEKSQERENIERLEMAHIKMESVLKISERWQITDMPLLQWRSKLKRAAQECDHTLLRCKQRALEEEEIRQWVSQSSIPRRIAHATKSLISSFIGTSNDESSNSSASVRRFERYANSANEFLKSIEFGGTPRKYTFFNPLISHLLRGKFLRYQAFQGSKFYYLGIRPMSFAERGVEAILGFFCQDMEVPTKYFSLGLMLRLSESTDIFGVIIKCMQSVTPHFKFAAEGVKRELTQLPTQDFSWVPHGPCNESEYWVNVHKTLTKRYRPNPLCCNEYVHNLITCSSTGNTTTSSSRLVSSIFAEEVIVVFLQFHVLLSDRHKSRLISAAKHGAESSLDLDMSPMKLGVLFIPHDSPEDIESAADSYALEVIDEKVKEMVHRNACLQDVDEKLLPKAIDYLYQNKESKMYQMCLKSRHGTAHLSMEKTSARTSCKTSKARVWDKRLVQQRGNCNVTGWKEASGDLIKFWAVCASDKLQGSISYCTVQVKDF